MYICTGKKESFYMLFNASLVSIAQLALKILIIAKGKLKYEQKMKL